MSRGSGSYKRGAVFRELIALAQKGLARERLMKRLGFRRMSRIYALSSEARARWREEFFDHGGRVNVLDPGIARGADPSPFWGGEHRLRAVNAGNFKSDIERLRAAGITGPITVRDLDTLNSHVSDTVDAMEAAEGRGSKYHDGRSRGRKK